MSAAGRLRERLTFQSRAEVADGYGNHEGAWVDRFTAAGRVLPLRGGEAVLGARLGGLQPVVITIRACAAAQAVTAAWRAVDARTGAVYALTSPAADMEESRQYLTIAATAGEPA